MIPPELVAPVGTDDDDEQREEWRLPKVYGRTALAEAFDVERVMGWPPGTACTLRVRDKNAFALYAGYVRLHIAEESRRLVELIRGAQACA